jgi:uridine phosphorylase
MRRAPIVSWTTKGKVWIDPKKELEYDIQQGAPARRYPTSAIMCYQEPMISLAVNRFHARKTDRLLEADFYEFVHRGKRIGIIRSDVGAPTSALFLERIIVRGVKRVINAGIAGSLQYEGIHPGDLVLCTKAIRNEGTSYHYQRPSKYSYPSKSILKQIENVLRAEEIPYHKGPTISIDGPYQYTIKECLRLRREGVLTSDMEASAVFAIAKFREVKAGAIFTISDLATKDFEWDPQFHSKELTIGFGNLFKVCVEALAR